MADPELKRLEVYRRVGDSLRLVLELSCEGQSTFTSSLFPGLVISLDKIFR